MGVNGPRTTPRRRLALYAAATLVLAVLVVTGVRESLRDDTPTPVAEQGCDQLAATLADARETMNTPDVNREALARASTDAGRVLERASELGCRNVE